MSELSSKQSKVAICHMTATNDKNQNLNYVNEIVKNAKQQLADVAI